MNRNTVFKHVLFVGPQYRDHRGGIGAVLATYSKSIQDFKFVSSYNGQQRILGTILYFVGTILKISLKLLSDRSIKVVHLHGASRGSFYRLYIIYLLSKYVFGKKIIYHLHAAGFKEFYAEANKTVKRCICHLMRNADLVICLSQYWYQYLNHQFIVNKLLILNNPIVAPSDLTPTKTKRSILNLLFLGEIGKRKGIFDLLNVMTIYSDELKGKIKLTIGGNGNIAKLKQVIEKNDLNGYVEFVGWVSGEKKHVLLSSCDVLVLPSYNEGLPITILEAMSYGKPILSTTAGGIPEIVKNCENGFLFEPGNEDQLKAGIDTFIKNPNLIESMGLDSKNKVEAYLIDNVLSKLENIYSEILNL